MDALALPGGIKAVVVTFGMSSTNQDARQRWQNLCDAPAQARRWDWYVLLRLVQCALPQRPLLGYGTKLEQDPVRLGQPPFFHPPPTNVAGMQPRGPREKEAAGPSPAQAAEAGSGQGRASVGNPSAPCIYSYHFGFFGPHGPLPLCLTEYAYRQIKVANDSAFAAFCDALHHRFLCFFFRAWADGRKELDWDRHETLEAGTRLSPDASDDAQGGWWDLCVSSLIGLGLDAVRRRDRIQDHAKLFYAGRLIQPTRNAEGLQAIVQDYFAVPALVIPFVRRVVKVPPAARWRLGPSASTGWLGHSTIVGETIEDYQVGFRIRLGPLKLAQLQEFLPETQGLGRLRDWVRLYVGKETDPNPQAGLQAAWDLQLVLVAGEVPFLVLGGGSRLGWTSWLISRPAQDDSEDLVVNPPAEPIETSPLREGPERPRSEPP